MGRKLDALLGRDSKTSKLKTMAKLAISRISILKNQRHVRCSHARSDVVQLLNLGHQDRALLRVEHVIREQNMLDVFVMIENYTHLLIQKVVLVQNNRECPEELNEAVSSLIFAASRCGEFPELQEIRGIFTSRYGKEFASRAVELRNGSRVNHKMIQRLSTRQANLESRKKVLKQIALDNRITLHLEDDVYVTAEEKQDVISKEKQLQPNEVANLNEPELGIGAHDFPEERTQDENFSESMKARKKYRDVAAAAREAFESATYAAAAARAAVELSRSESWDEDSDDQNSSNHKREIGFISDGSSRSKLEIDGDAASEDVEPSDRGWGFDKIHPLDSFSSESEGGDMAHNIKRSHFKDNRIAGLERTFSNSSSDTDIDNQKDRKATPNLDQSHRTATLGEDIVFDESDNKTGKNQASIPWRKHHHSSSDEKYNLPINKFPKTANYNAAADESLSDKKGYNLHCQSPKWKPLNPQAEPMQYSVEGRSRLGNSHYLNAEKHLYSRRSHMDRKPTSMTSRQASRD